MSAGPVPTRSRSGHLDDRGVRPLPTLRHRGWSIKVYGIGTGDGPRPELVRASIAAAEDALPPADGAHGAGFLVIHDGGIACWALLFWWSEHILLHEKLFRADSDTPDTLRPVTDGLVGCVYELAVVTWERRAWLQHAVEDDDLDAYLADQLPPGPAIGTFPTP